MTLPGASLDQALVAAIHAERRAIPGFVKRAGETLGKPPFEHKFLEGCRRSLQALVGGAADGGVLQVCSSRHDEGRSSVAAGMALALARTYGERVAVLDLDFTGNALTRLFSVSLYPGLADWLEGGERLRVVIGGSNRLLYLLPAGQHYRDPALLYSEVLKRKVVETCVRNFPWVVMDLPPLLIEPAGAQLIPLGRWRILVGRYRETILQDLEETVEMFQHQGTTGFVLTGDSSRVPSGIRRLI